MVVSSTHRLHGTDSNWEAVPVEFPRETIATAIVKASGSAPDDSIAIKGPVCNGARTITWKGFIDKAFSIANFLGEQEPDSYVGILMPRDYEHPVCALGVMLSGAAFLPMSATIPEDRIKYILEDSGCKTILTTKDYSTKVDFFEGRVLIYDDIPTVPRSSAGLEAMLKRVSTSNLAYAIYTSGTTGKPKGVEVEHLGVLNMLEHHKLESLQKDDVKECVMVASFIFDSSIREMFLPLVCGTCLCIAENVLNITCGTCVGGTPSGLGVAEIPNTMRAALVGGERLTPACVKHLSGVSTIVNVYGPTETTVECTTHMTNRSKEDEIALIGKPIRNVHAYACDKDTGALLRQGEQGELWISGPGVARGYRNRPDLNKDKFIANQWKMGERTFRTGDLVKFKDSGDIEFLGRTDSQVKIRGYRIELEEIERVCAEVPHVKNACVIVAKDLRNADQIVTYVEPPVEEESVLEFCRAKMPPYMVPAKVMMVDKFPLTVSGKIDKRKLDPVVWAPPVEAGLGDVVAPATATERALVNLITNIFELECSANADFFNEMGLTSLDCAALVAEARAIGLKIPGTGVVLANPTVQKLAAVLDNANSGGEKEKTKKRRLGYECNDNITGDEMLNITDAQLSRLSQFVVYGIGFVFQLLLVYYPIVFCTSFLYTEGYHLTKVDCTAQQLMWKPNCGIYRDVLTLKLGSVTLPSDYVATMLTVPVMFTVMTPLTMIWVVFLKWMCMGRYKPGIHAAHSWSYVQWWFTHGTMTFMNAFIMPHFRNTFVLNWYYRALGASIGSGTVMDTTAILEPDLITIGKNCKIQSDVLLNGHKLRWMPVVETQVICFQTIEVADEVIIGPGCTLVPKDSCSGVRISSDMPALTSAQMLPEDYESFKDQVVWQPKIPIVTQLFTFVLSGLFHWIALMFPITTLYWIAIWSHKIRMYFVLWWVHFYWSCGIPYMLLVLMFKWTVIRKFREGPSSFWIDQKRFMLAILLQSQILRNVSLLGASCQVLTYFCRAMGMHVGWNAQVMPHTIVETDLVSVGDCVAFGGLVSFFPRDKNGDMRPIFVGNYSAVTNSAVMMAGSSVGENSLVGNLTLCKTDTIVPDNTKAVGNPMIQFGNEADPVEINRTRSNVVTFGHLVASYLVELVDVPPFVILIYAGKHLFFDPIKYGISDLLVEQNSTFVNAISPVPHMQQPIVYVAEIPFLVIFFPILIVVTVCLFRLNFCPRLSGTHMRDSWVFIQFIYFTKIMVSTDFHVFRMLNGTPFMPLIYNWMGGKMDLSSLLFFRHCADFDELTIKKNAIVEFDSYLEMHQKTATELLYEPVLIDENAVVGQRSILLRGSVLSVGSSVSPNSTVLPGEEVPVGSIIAMNPGVVIPRPDETNSNDFVKASATGGHHTMAGNKAALKHQEEAAAHGVPAGGGRRASVAGKGAGRASVQGKAAAGARCSIRDLSGKLVAPESLTVDTNVKKVDMVIVGAGVCGLIAAEEIKRKNKSYMILEKSADVGGCWLGAANKTSHVAVSEPSYRFNYDHKGKYPSDFTGRDELLKDCKRYIAAHDLAVTTQAQVTRVEKDSEGWTVTYVLTATKMCTVKCAGVFMALGAQQTPRLIKLNGEDSFTGTISTGIQDHMPVDKFKDAKVVIVGGGAFACENLRTALMHGAQHVTIVYRTALQCWPRVVHYQATIGDCKLGDLGKAYEVACKWAGLEGILEPFMSKKCTAQPTASDMFFFAYKSGRLTLKKGQITEVKERSVVTQDGQQFDCDVLMKCLGWQEPPLRKVFPDFESRRFVFLNGYASCSFVSDPHYQHKAGSNRALASLTDLPVKGGTFSVLALATVSIRLQLYFMDHPEDYHKAMAQLPESPEPVCNWFQQRWDFEDLPGVNKVIDDTLKRFKDQAKEKFPATKDYLEMTSQRLAADISTFLPRNPGYIFNPDCSGNFYDMPADCLYDKAMPTPKKDLQKAVDETQVEISLQKSAVQSV
jgi:non-ribosomal peptide synthetase-like protein